ncbi:MAG: NAD(P)-dependent oxidoreductase, partial [Variovorax sp.]
MPPLKIALVGGSGRVGRHVALEAERRGHLLRSLPRAEFDVFDAAALARGLQGRDVLVSAYGAPAELAQLLVRATASMLEA